MKTIIAFIKALYQVVYSNLGLIFLIQVIAGLVLIVPSQAHELVDIYFGKDLGNDIQWYNVSVLLACVLFWSTINYMVVYLNLYIASNTQTNDDTKLVTKWSPVVFAAMPVVITMIAFGSNFYFSVLNIIIIGTYQVLVDRGIIKTGDLTKNRSKGNSLLDDYRVLVETKTFRNILFMYAISLFVLIIALITPHNRLMQHIGTPAIAVLGFAFITFVFGIASFFNDSASRPVLILLFVYLFICSNLNDNSLIRTVEDHKMPTQIGVSEHFNEWVKHRIDTTTKPKVLPIYLIAAEGGGIRAMIWTAQVMRTLEATHPEITKNIYALSGVSGGGTGLAYYFAHLHDKQQQTITDSDSLYDVFLKQDFLSDVTGGLFFSDGFQSFLPTGIAAFDRTKKLEDAFSNHYKRIFDLTDSANVYQQPFTELWYKKDKTYNYDLPSLFINSTLAETGQRAITSNLALDMDSLNVVNVIATTQKDMPFKTANILMARFPFITKGGLIKNNERKIGHLTDGGYFENTGIESLIYLYFQLKKNIDSLEKKQNIVIEPHIVFIQNSTFKNDNSKTKPATFFYGITTIFQSFYQPWNNGTQTRNNVYKNLLKGQKNKVQYTRISFDELKDHRTAPLGWYLSPKTADTIKIVAQKRVRNHRF